MEDEATYMLLTLDWDRHRKAESIMVILQVNNNELDMEFGKSADTSIISMATYCQWWPNT